MDLSKQEDRCIEIGKIQSELEEIRSLLFQRPASKMTRARRLRSVNSDRVNLRKHRPGLFALSI